MESWKLHKSNDKANRANYRPITILNTLSKLAERHVNTHLYNFLNTRNLLYILQSGFRTLHSCETALLQLTSDWLKAMNDGEISGVILLDLRKAFDLVDHNILLRKLELYGCDDSSTKWFTSFLKGRTQYVKFQNSKSNQREVKVGVPQGSILGPTLFVLCANDLHLPF